MAPANNQTEQPAEAVGWPTMLDPQLFMAARHGDSKRLHELLLLLDEDEYSSPSPPLLGDAAVTLDGDTLLHVIAACGDGEEFIRCAEMIFMYHQMKHGADAMRQVLQWQNRKGDTPLHCAAGAGNLNMISCLVALSSGGGETTETTMFLRSKNSRGETALHQAVRAAKNKRACVCELMSVDPDLARIPCDGEDYASALYLAIWLGEMEVARHLLDKTGGNLSYSGPHGQNVFHAAVHRGTGGGGRGAKDDAEAALGMLLGQTFVVINGQGERQQQQDMMMRTTGRVPLLSQLLNQRDMKQGLNPLCLAVSLPATTANTVRLLLDANVSAAYQPDRNGSYPIHVAASGDCPDFVRILLQKCPDCATLRDGYGRTFLHVAVNQKNYRVVEFAVNVRPQLSILSAQDDDGDTALHRAVQVGDMDIFNCLIRNPQVRPDVPNAQGLTPLRLARELRSASVIQNSLESLVGAPRSVVPDTRKDWEKSQDLSQATQVMGTVSVLVATVTFASAFTLPGGYRSSDSANDTDGAAAAAGTPLLAGSYAFDAFILADTLAFVCSSMATFSLLFAGMPYMDLSVRHRFFHASFRLMKGAGEILLAAFALGLYLVLAPVAHATAIIVCIIALASLLYGNLQTRYLTSTANAVRARLGIRTPATKAFARALLRYFLGRFWAFIIIFGIPAAIRIISKVQAGLHGKSAKH